MKYQTIKRFFDFLSAIIALALLSPIFLTVLLCLIFVNNGRPFFFQQRPGKNEKIFQIIKFKTMRDLNPNVDKDVNDLNRVTKIGSFIRKYSLDEIPQLINVIKGDMSIVGPRPLLTHYLPLYNDFEKQRHNARPGITGWAQVKGRNSISWQQKFKLDVWYIQNQSFMLDLNILLLTVKRIIIPQGINSSEDKNMPEFTGTKL